MFVDKREIFRENNDQTACDSFLSPTLLRCLYFSRFSLKQLRTEPAPVVIDVLVADSCLLDWTINTVLQQEACSGNLKKHKKRKLLCGDTSPGLACCIKYLMAPPLGAGMETESSSALCKNAMCLVSSKIVFLVPRLCNHETETSKATQRFIQGSNPESQTQQKSKPIHFHSNTKTTNLTFT